MSWKPDTPQRVLTNPDKLKRIKVTCRCGVTSIQEIPGELFEVGIVPMIECDSCHQLYALMHGKLIRLDKYKQPEKAIEATVPINSVAAADEIEKLMEEFRRQGKVVQKSAPDSSKIN